MSTSDISPLIAAIYHAIEDPNAWDEFLKLLGGHLPFDTAALNIHEAPEYTAILHTDLSFDAAARAAYDAGYRRRISQAREAGSHGLPLSDCPCVEFGEERGVPSHFSHSMGCKLSDGGSGATYLTLSRHAAYGCFTDAERSVMNALLDHLQRATRIIGRISLLESLHDALLESGGAAFIVAANLRILEANAEGEALLRSGRLFSEANGLLEISEPGRAMLARLAAGASETERIVDPAGQDYVVKAIPVSRKALLSSEGPHTVLVVRQPMGAQARSLSRQFGAQFKLTAAEMRLVEAFLASPTLGEASAAIGISPNTAKTHLTRILRKTGARNQRQLVQLISRFQTL